MGREIELINGEEVLWCSGCQAHLPLFEFSRDSANNVGYAYQCKVCLRKRQMRRKKPEGYDPHNIKLAMEMLEAMGYDIEQNIHEQFKEKHPELFGGSK